MAGRREIIIKIIATLILESLCMLVVVSLWLRIKLYPIKELTGKMDEIKTDASLLLLKKFRKMNWGFW